MAKAYIGHETDTPENVSRWDGRVFYYFKGQSVGPGLFINGPEYFTIDRAGYYRWEYIPPPRGNIGPWSLCGPYRYEHTATKGV